jgi:hypothetical protein
MPYMKNMYAQKATNPQQVQPSLKSLQRNIAWQSLCYAYNALFVCWSLWLSVGHRALLHDMVWNETTPATYVPSTSTGMPKMHV